MSGPYASRKSKGKRSYKNLIILAAIVAVSFVAFFWSYDNWYDSGASVEASTGYVFSNSSTITVIVSKDFCRETMVNETIPYEPGMTALSALQKVSDVDADGSGFVNAINGVRSQYTGMGDNAKPVDWFYYVNGIFATVYSPGYTMHPGDVMRWDYHVWDENNAMGGVTDEIIGDLFAGFAYGYGGKVPPTYIVDTGGYAEEANTVQKAFTGWGIKTEVVKASDLTDTEKDEGSLVLVGTFNDPVISEVNGFYDELGLPYHYDGGEVKFFDYKRAETGSLKECGIVGASKSPFNPKGSYLGENVIWSCTGVTHENVDEAVDLLATHPETLKDKFGCVVIDRDVYGVP